MNSYSEPVDEGVSPTIVPQPPQSQTEEQEEMSAATQERLRILRMIEEDKISAEEGAALLSALGQNRKGENLPPEPGPGKPTWFRVRVTDTFTGRAKASVTIPVRLMEWGLKIGGQFAPEVAGVNLDELNQLLYSGAEGKIIDVIDEVDGEHVEIFVD